MQECELGLVHCDLKPSRVRDGLECDLKPLRVRDGLESDLKPSRVRDGFKCDLKPSRTRDGLENHFSALENHSLFFSTRAHARSHELWWKKINEINISGGNVGAPRFLAKMLISLICFHLRSCAFARAMVEKN